MIKTVGILARRSQDRPKTGLRWPMIGPRPPKMAPEWLQRVPRWPKTGPRQRQDGPRQAQDAARVAREGAKMAQDRPKTGARYLAPASQGLKRYLKTWLSASSSSSWKMSPEGPEPPFLYSPFRQKLNKMVGCGLCDDIQTHCGKA